jgi:predicted O-linked N-acetylglucosamine transferase (SPINDLY family)
MTLQQALSSALKCLETHRFSEAESICRQVLTQQPKSSDALHLLGLAAFKTKRPQIAADLIRRAIAILPTSPNYHLNLSHVMLELNRPADAEAACRQALALRADNPIAHATLGNALAQQNRMEEAIAAFRQAIALKPNYALAYSNIANALTALKRFDEAEASYRKAIEVNPDFAEAWSNLAALLRSRGDLEQSIACCRKALEIRPDCAQAVCNLANAICDQGRIDDAIAEYHRAIAVDPNLPESHNNLSVALGRRGRYDQAYAANDKAIALRPNYSQAWNNRATLLRDQGRLEEAIAACRRALEISPNMPEAHHNLATALLDSGRVEQAIESARRAVALNPTLAEPHNTLANALKEAGSIAGAIEEYDRSLALRPDPGIHSNRIYVMQFLPGCDAQTQLREQRRWNEIHAKPLAKFIAPLGNDPSPALRLRIGYVSPYFYDQAESFFVVPLLEAHDRKDFEIHCYASIMRPDAITERHRRAADVWHDVLGRTDAELAEQIRNDRIDILIDLTMHMAYNRALAFARKPAPIQVAWLAYPGGTGLDVMDYRITDSFLDPPDADLSCYGEQSIRLPDTWCCYHPLSAIPPAPPRSAGPIRFGSLNNPCKLNEPLLRLWARVMQAVPDSTLLLQAVSELHCRKIRELFESLGISPSRIKFVPRIGREQYLRLYDQIDIGLDPLPYNGITTTCDALWMNVPVVTLKGNTAPGRAGLSILQNLGLPELAANDLDQFVSIITTLAGDRGKLNELRAGLRDRMLASPIMDAPRFARNMESAYRQMWQTAARRL